jgi:hypothetical protein
MAGTTAGGMAMTLVANHVILESGWRAAYVALGLPMIVVGPVSGPGGEKSPAWGGEDECGAGRPSFRRFRAA